VVLSIKLSVRRGTMTNKGVKLSSSSHTLTPTTHGNPVNFDPNLYKLLFSTAIVDDAVEGEDIISKARGQKPLLVVKVALLSQRVMGIEKPPKQGKYANIPVPLF